MNIKTLLITPAIALAAASTSQGSLILTGIMDGTLAGGTPKVIELYVTTDIADLSLYGVELVSNAGSSAGSVETFFSGTATAGEFIYVSTEAPKFTSVLGFAPNFTTNDVNHNGDDDFYIYGPAGAVPGGTLLDTWGGSDAVDNTGTVADLLDSWAYRANGTSANTTFTSSEWTITAPNSLDGLTAAEMNTAFPNGTFTAAGVPEPSSLLLGALGGLALLRRRR